ncbi:MAG: hypothetical protein H6636_02645 [Anaerolineales bacterium]|nr:hypothetical protein [Anaerolineales bacterium]
MPTKRAFLLLLPLLLACQIFTPTPAPPTPTPIPLHLSNITFDDPLTQTRMLALDRCMSNLATSSEWRHFPYENIGAFIEAKWCTGSRAAPDCQITEGNQNQRDQHVLNLYTLHYGDDVTNAFGLGLSARWVPPQTGPQTDWSAAFSFSEGGRTVVGEGFSLSFKEYGSALEPLNELNFGMSNDYKIGETTLTYPAQHPQRDELALYIASPESFLAKGQSVLNGLSETVQAALDAHTIMTCDYGPYNGDGIPPACNPRPMTADEEQVARDEATQYFANQLAVLAANYEAMFAALEEAFPFETCWK